MTVETQPAGKSPIPHHEGHGISRRKFITLAGGGAAAAGLTALGLSQLNKKDATPAASTGAASSEPIATPKVEVTTTPIAPKTPELEQKQSLLSAELMKQAERVRVGPEGTTGDIYLGFKDLPPGTPVYSPVDGFLTIDKESGPQFSGYDIFIRKATGGGTEIRGVLRVDNIVQRDLKSGVEVIGYITSEKTLDGRYSLLVTITKRTPDGAVIDEDALKEMFPSAF